MLSDEEEEDDGLPRTQQHPLSTTERKRARAVSKLQLYMIDRPSNFIYGNSNPLIR